MARTKHDRRQARRRVIIRRQIRGIYRRRNIPAPDLREINLHDLRKMRKEMKSW